MDFAQWEIISAYTVIFPDSLPMTFEECYCNWHFADTFMNLSIFPSEYAIPPSLSKDKLHFWKISFITYSQSYTLIANNPIRTAYGRNSF